MISPRALLGAAVGTCSFSPTTWTLLMLHRFRKFSPISNLLSYWPFFLPEEPILSPEQQEKLN
jgi:hypothetical protein